MSIAWPPHECRESINERHQGFCDCGRKLRDGSRPARRNIELEREFTREAARGLVDPDRLIEMAEARAASLSSEYVTDPMLIQSGRDRLHDVCEELLDGRNHLVFWLQTNVGHELAPDAMIALRFICLAFDRLLEK